MSKTDREDAPINTIIGAGARFFGEVEAPGFLRIDGQVKGGPVRASGRVVIGEKARIRSDVEGTSIIVGGVIEGDIIASESVKILSSALVLGDIVTKRIIIDDGVVLRGRVVACGTEAFETRLQAFRDARSVAVAASGTGTMEFGHSDG